MVKVKYEKSALTKLTLDLNKYAHAQLLTGCIILDKSIALYLLPPKTPSISVASDKSPYTFKVKSEEPALVKPYPEAPP